MSDTYSSFCFLSLKLILHHPPIPISSSSELFASLGFPMSFVRFTYPLVVLLPNTEFYIPTFKAFAVIPCLYSSTPYHYSRVTHISICAEDFILCRTVFLWEYKIMVRWQNSTNIIKNKSNQAVPTWSLENVIYI